MTPDQIESFADSIGIDRSRIDYWPNRQEALIVWTGTSKGRLLANITEQTILTDALWSLLR